MIPTNLGRGSTVSKWRVVLAVTAVAAGVALSPRWANSAPTRTLLAERPAAASASVTVTVKVSCPQRHRGADGLPYCDRRGDRP